MVTRRWEILLAGLFGGLGVGIGAYHAHGLEAMLERSVAVGEIEDRMRNVEIGVRYQLIHAVALLAVGAIAERRSSRYLAVATILFAIGVTLFSGGLYLVVFAENLSHAAIIPVGGALMIGGWVLVFVHGCRRRPASSEDRLAAGRS